MDENWNASSADLEKALGGVCTCLVLIRSLRGRPAGGERGYQAGYHAGYQAGYHLHDLALHLVDPLPPNAVALLQLALRLHRDDLHPSLVLLVLLLYPLYLARVLLRELQAALTDLETRMSRERQSLMGPSMIFAHEQRDTDIVLGPKHSPRPRAPAASRRTPLPCVCGLPRRRARTRSLRRLPPPLWPPVRGVCAPRDFVAAAPSPCRTDCSGRKVRDSPVKCDATAGAWGSPAHVERGVPWRAMLHAQERLLALLQLQVNLALLLGFPRGQLLRGQVALPLLVLPSLGRHRDLTQGTRGVTLSACTARARRLRRLRLSGSARAPSCGRPRRSPCPCAPFAAAKWWPLSHPALFPRWKQPLPRPPRPAQSRR